MQGEWLSEEAAAKRLRERGDGLTATRGDRTDRTNKDVRNKKGKERERMDDIYNIIMRVGKLVVAFIVGVAVCAVLTCLTGCRTVRYVSVPEYHTEYKARTDSVLKHDSVWVHDSVAVRLMGDTVWRDRWHTETAYKYLYKVKTDTVLRTDSVMVPMPVERRLGWWEQRKVELFWPITIILLGVVGVMLWLARKRNKS